MIFGGIIHGYLMSPSPGHACGATTVLSGVAAGYTPRKRQYCRAAKARVKVRCAAGMSKGTSTAEDIGWPADPMLCAVSQYKVYSLPVWDRNIWAVVKTRKGRITVVSSYEGNRIYYM